MSTLYVADKDDEGQDIVTDLNLEYENGKWHLSAEDAAAYAGKTLYLERTIEVTCALQESIPWWPTYSKTSIK